jgi:Xaa-Pro aminopeptidase
MYAHLYKRFSLQRYTTMSTFAAQTMDAALANVQLKLQEQQLDLFLVPSADAHGSEYVSKRDERRAFVTNFTGSAGLAAVVASPTELKTSCLFTDSRYKLQSKNQLSNSWTAYIAGEKNAPKLTEWLKKNYPTSKVGFDPRHASIATVQSWKSAFKNSTGIELIEVLDNPIDAVWEDFGRVPPSTAPIWSLPTEVSGEAVSSKITALRKNMAEKKTRIAVVSALDDVAWLLNLRGSDIPYTPLFIAYCVVSESTVTLCVNQNQLSTEATDALKEANVNVESYDNIVEVLRSMAATKATTEAATKATTKTIDKTKTTVTSDSPTVNASTSSSSSSTTTLTPSTTVWLDPSSANWHLRSTCQKLGYSIYSQVPLPIALSKAIKNQIEMKAIKKAHVIDGVALCKYFHWLEETMAQATAEREQDPGWNGELTLDEVNVADQLYKYRQETTSSFIGNSFSTISSSGPNGAIVVCCLASVRPLFQVRTGCCFMGSH